MRLLLLAGAVSLASLSAALAETSAEPSAPPSRAPETRMAEGVFERFWGREEHHGERRGHHGRHWREDDDDDDDDDRGGRRHGASNRPADPNSADAPLPDNGVFNGKARPKVEVQ